MSQKLATHAFFWLTENEIQELVVMTIPDDSEEGYILEVDLEYPPDLHDKPSDYPLAPDKMKLLLTCFLPIVNSWMRTCTSWEARLSLN